jgi:hydroxymethylglutaryl-CoA reductase
MSPRTYTEKKDKLERWVRLEQEDIQKTKVQYQKEWVKAIKMIEDT